MIPSPYYYSETHKSELSSSCGGNCPYHFGKISTFSNTLIFRKSWNSLKHYPFCWWVSVCGFSFPVLWCEYELIFFPRLKSIISSALWAILIASLSICSCWLSSSTEFPSPVLHSPHCAGSDFPSLICSILPIISNSINPSASLKDPLQSSNRKTKNCLARVCSTNPNCFVHYSCLSPFFYKFFSCWNWIGRIPSFAFRGIWQVPGVSWFFQGKDIFPYGWDGSL